jgi:hypothetical protein
MTNVKKRRNGGTEYAAELRQRLEDGRSIHTTCAWFVRAITREALRDAGFTPRERELWRHVVDGHVAFYIRYVLQP